jgi:hypothetical protein
MKNMGVEIVDEENKYSQSISKFCECKIVVINTLLSDPEGSVLLL